MTEPKDPKEPSCGSSSCLVDRFSATLTEQHKVGIDSIKTLMITQHNMVMDVVREFKAKVEKDNDEMWPRLRNVETSITVLQNSIGPNLDDKIRKVSRDDSDAHTGRSWKRSLVEVAGMVIATVTAAIIIAHLIEPSSNNMPEPHHRSAETTNPK